MRRLVAPAPEWHPATCHHKACCCYNPTSHETDGDCQHCRRSKRNKEDVERYRQEQAVRTADPVSRHPEGYTQHEEDDHEAV